MMKKLKIKKIVIQIFIKYKKMKIMKIKLNKKNK